MDALKLFYETKLGPARRTTPDRTEPAVPAVAAARAPDALDAPEALLRHIEQHAGQPLRSRAAIDAYLATLTAPRGEARQGERSLLRESMLVLFLVVAVLQYYYIDVSLQIAALRNVTVFVPVEQAQKPRTTPS